MSTSLFLIVLDSAMSRATREGCGIQWVLQARLKDIDYADDICLLSHSLRHKNQTGSDRKFNSSSRSKSKRVQSQGVAHQFRYSAIIQSSEKNH